MIRWNWLVSVVVMCLASACIDTDLLNISDSLETEASYSLPVGSYSFDINDYLVNLDTVTIPWPDSLYFNNVLFPNMADAVLFSTTSPFDFNLMPNAGEEIQSVEVVVIVSNGYPTDLTAQVYFNAGSPPTASDSAFHDGPKGVAAGPLNADGLVVKPNVQVFTIPMPPDFLDNLTSFSMIRIAGEISTRRADITRVKFFSEYRVMVHVGYRIVLKVNTGKL